MKSEKHRIKDYGLRIRENIAGSQRTVMCNVEPLLPWIPTPAPDPDPGFAGMTESTNSDGVMGGRQETDKKSGRGLPPDVRSRG